MQARKAGALALSSAILLTAGSVPRKSPAVSGEQGPRKLFLRAMNCSKPGTLVSHLSIFNRSKFSSAILVFNSIPLAIRNFLLLFPMIWRFNLPKV
jgi:hypothetical protein